MEILTSSWVVPVSAPPLREGRVAVRDGRVAWVGHAGEPGEPDGVLRDFGPGVLLPGLVNAHCHLELSHLAGRIEASGGFVAWVQSLVDARAGEEDETVRAGAAAAIRELEATGTAAVGDVSNRLLHVDLLAASGLRAVVFHELLAWDPERAAAAVEAAEAKVAALERSVGPGVQLRLAAHAPYSASAALFAALVRRGGPAALHLAESADESRFLRDGGGPWRDFLVRRRLGHVAFEPPGTSPVRYLEDLGVLHSGLVAAHCVQVDRADRELLARRGVRAVICPRSNRTLGVGIAPVPELIEAGVHLALGTDSLASAPSLDLLADAALLHREFPGLPPAVIVRMATAGGAEALGLADLGAIAPGRTAALAHAACDPPPQDPLAWLVSGEARLRRVGP